MDLVFTCFTPKIGNTDAGWSSSVARWAHNPEVVGSNPAPATRLKEVKISQKITHLLRDFYFIRKEFVTTNKDDNAIAAAA